MTPARQAYALIEAGRPEDALALTAPMAARPDASHALLAAHATALKALGRLEEVLGVHRRAAAAWPDSGVAWHNLAATLGDLRRPAEAVEATDRALASGLDAAETWLVRARALWALHQPEPAAAAFREALARDPANLAAARELAQLVWLRTGDPVRSAEHLDAVIAAGADPAKTLWIRAQLLTAAGRDEAARELLIREAERRPDAVELSVMAAQAAVEAGRAETALALARHAMARQPGEYQVDIRMAMALLAAGRDDEALQAARQAAAKRPDMQDAWAWVATAARAAGDPAYEALYAYDEMVRSYRIRPPAPWTDLEAYLTDLAAELDALHDTATHPFDQSLRHGTQTFGELRGQGGPAVEAFYRAIDPAIRAHIDALGTGSDPLRSRSTGRYRLSGSWSVRLRRQGRHLHHYHPEGWLSSAFYVRIPDEALQRGREGWIGFGGSPFPSRTPLDVAHWVRPEAGLLVLFPSYMWHGTEPFDGEKDRMTIAFDIVPA